MLCNDRVETERGSNYVERAHPATKDANRQWGSLCSTIKVCLTCLTVLHVGVNMGVN